MSTAIKKSTVGVSKEEEKNTIDTCPICAGGVFRLPHKDNTDMHEIGLVCGAGCGWRCTLASGRNARDILWRRLREARETVDKLVAENKVLKDAIRSVSEC